MELTDGEVVQYTSKYIFTNLKIQIIDVLILRTFIFAWLDDIKNIQELV